MIDLTFFWRRIARPLLILSFASPICAADFCVSTGNQLAAALATAGSNSQDDTIKIEYGTLTTDTRAPQDYQWVYFAPSDEYSTTISGGWSKGNSCASIATTDPAATTLDAQWIGPVFLADMSTAPAGDFSGNLTIRNLTFARGKAFDVRCSTPYYLLDCDAGLRVDVDMATGSSLVLENLLVRNSTAAPGSNPNIASVFARGSGIVRIRNNIVMGNDLSGGDVTNGVSISASDNVIAYVANNSVFGNTTKQPPSGMEVSGVATVANNVVANNATANGLTAAQFQTRTAELLTLRNNHFATRQYVGYQYPYAESGTTTGDAQWTLSGYRRTPNTESILRDSGLNNPVGGLPSIDYSGRTRIINTVVDRGAVEADAVPPLGPNVTPDSPLNGSTTLVFGTAGYPRDEIIRFDATGGTLNGTTELLCAVISGNATIVNGASQTIPYLGIAIPVEVRIPITNSMQNHSVLCSFARFDGPVGTYQFNFRAGPDLLLSNGFE